LDIFPFEGDYQWDFYSVRGSIDVSDIKREVRDKKSKHERECVSWLDIIDHREISAVCFGRGVYRHRVWPVGN
jgi:hypothetical protein